MVDIQLQWTKAGLVLSDFRVCKVVLSSCETLHEREWQIDLGHLLIVAQKVTDWSEVKRILESGNNRHYILVSLDFMPYFANVEYSELDVCTLLGGRQSRVSFELTASSKARKAW